MFDSVLVVCIGNICRSPVGERLLRQMLPAKTISSAGLSAVVGAAADSDAAAIATANGVDMDGHVSRQLTEQIAAEHDLILVMEPSHKQELTNRFPQMSGKTMLFDQWTGAKGIADPYMRSVEFHEAVFKQISEAAIEWKNKLDR